MSAYPELTRAYSQENIKFKKDLEAYEHIKGVYIKRKDDLNKLYKMADNEVRTGNDLYRRGCMRYFYSFRTSRGTCIDFKMKQPCLYNKVEAAKMIKEKCQSRMSASDFKRMMVNYQFSDKLNNNIVDYQNIQDITPTFYPTARESLNELFSLVHKEVDMHYSKLFKGHLAEDWFGVELENKLKSSHVNIYLNVFIGKGENDALLICDKGVFSVEVKDHNSTMVWDKDKNFKELNYGIRSDDSFSDPYKQTLMHQEQCNKEIYEHLGFNEAYAKGVVVLIGQTAKAIVDNEEVAKRVFASADEFISYIDSLEPIMTAEQVKMIVDRVEEVKKDRDPKFLFPDYKMVDEFFCDLIDFFAMDMWSDTPEVRCIKKYLTFCKTYYVDGKTYDFNRSFERERDELKIRLDSYYKNEREFVYKHQDPKKTDDYLMALISLAMIVFTGFLLIMPFVAGAKYLFFLLFTPFLFKSAVSLPKTYLEEKKAYFEVKKEFDKYFEYVEKERNSIDNCPELL